MTTIATLSPLSSPEQRKLDTMRIAVTDHAMERFRQRVESTYEIDAAAVSQIVARSVAVPADSDAWYRPLIDVHRKKDTSYRFDEQLSLLIVIDEPEKNLLRVVTCYRLRDLPKSKEQPATYQTPKFSKMSRSDLKHYLADLEQALLGSPSDRLRKRLVGEKRMVELQLFKRRQPYAIPRK